MRLKIWVPRCLRKLPPKPVMMPKKITTATVLAQSIIAVGLKNVIAGANPMDLKRGIDKAVIEIVNSLEQAQTIGDDYKKIESVAKVSANMMKTIGALIAEAMQKVQKEGVITIEESKVPILTLMWLKACSLTVDTSLPTLLPMQKKWQLNWKIHIS